MNFTEDQIRKIQKDLLSPEEYERLMEREAKNRECVEWCKFLLDGLARREDREGKMEFLYQELRGLFDRED